MTERWPGFQVGLLAELGFSVTQGRLDFLQHWENGENTGAKYNPLATIEPGGEDPANPYWNTFYYKGVPLHVRNYASLAAGIKATADTIRQDNFKLIFEALRNQTVSPQLADVIENTWGTVAFAAGIRAGYNPFGAKKTLEQRVGDLELLLCANGWTPPGGRMIFGQEALDLALSHGFSVLESALLVRAALAAHIVGDTNSVNKILADALKKAAANLEAQG